MGVSRPIALPNRGDVYLVELDTTRDSGTRKKQPCVIVSPNELNHHLRTVMVAPMTTAGHAYPFRPSCRFGGKEGRVALDQLRAVDRERLRKRLGALTPTSLATVFATLGEMFAR